LYESVDGGDRLALGGPRLDSFLSHNCPELIPSQETLVRLPFNTADKNAESSPVCLGLHMEGVD